MVQSTGGACKKCSHMMFLLTAHPVLSGMMDGADSLHGHVHLEQQASRVGST